MIGSDRDGAQIKWPILLPNLFEDTTVASVTSKPETLCSTCHCPATPQGLPFVTATLPGAPMLQHQQTSEKFKDLRQDISDESAESRCTAAHLLSGGAVSVSMLRKCMYDV